MIGIHGGRCVAIAVGDRWENSKQHSFPRFSQSLVFCQTWGNIANLHRDPSSLPRVYILTTRVGTGISEVLTFTPTISRCEVVVWRTDFPDRTCPMRVKLDAGSLTSARPPPREEGLGMPLEGASSQLVKRERSEVKQPCDVPACKAPASIPQLFHLLPEFGEFFIRGVMRSCEE